MKPLVAVALFVFCGSVFAQQPQLEMASVSARSKPAPVASSSTAERPDLHLLLANLGQATTATDGDISSLQAGAGKSGWFKGGSHGHQAAELAASLDRNLKDAMPVLMREAQDSQGSVTATFKLYNDLSVLVESVGLLAETAESNGRKADSDSLRNDYKTLTRLRQELASYIQSTADSLEPAPETPRRNAPSPSYATVLSASNRVPVNRHVR